MVLPPRIGRYEVELLIGEGSTGRVFLGRDPVLRRQVAIRVMRGDAELGAEDRPRLADRLLHGAQASAGLSNPTLVAVHDVSDDDDLGRFIVYELGRGASLRERLSGGPLSKTEAASLARALGGALAQAHSCGVAHGNLKPQKVLLSPEGYKITGFVGLPAATHAGADQRALAATLYEALTGQPPPDPATAAVSKASAVWPAGLRSCPNLDAIFERALAREPRRQFSSCEIFAGALAASLEYANGPLMTPPVSQGSIVSRSTRRWQNVAAGGGVALIVALLALDRQPHSRGLSLKAVAASFASAAAPRSGPRRLHASAGAPSGTALLAPRSDPALRSAPGARVETSGAGPTSTPRSSAPAVTSNETTAAGPASGGPEAPATEAPTAAPGVPRSSPSATAP